jgi:DNA polymerase III alpha subunit
MVKQKGSHEKIAGLEMSDLEALGHVKFDVLGINLLDKIMKIQEITGVANG